MNDQSKKEMAEALWAEINRAIVNSNRVRDCLHSMKEKDILDYLCEHDFLLDGRKLINEMLNEPEQIDEPQKIDESQKKLRTSLDMFLGDREQSFPSVKSSLFPKGFFSIN